MAYVFLSSCLPHHSSFAPKPFSILSHEFKFLSIHPPPPTPLSLLRVLFSYSYSGNQLKSSGPPCYGSFLSPVCWSLDNGPQSGVFSLRYGCSFLELFYFTHLYIYSLLGLWDKFDGQQIWISDSSELFF